MEKNLSFKALRGDAGKRLDVYLALQAEGMTRSAIKNLIGAGKVLVNKRPKKPGYPLREDDEITLVLPPLEESGLKPEPTGLDIIYEDNDIIVVNKPPGMAVHPGAGMRKGTLVNALLAHTERLSDAGGPERPGIVHRLDKDTTGVIVIAKDNSAHAGLARQFKEHTIKRRYMAIAWGRFKNPHGSIDVPIGRDLTKRKMISGRTKRPRRARTCYNVIKEYDGLSLVELIPETGRTHQIRVHLSIAGHPIAGDALYCRRRVPHTLKKGTMDALRRIKRQCLHAETLGFLHPRTHEHMEFHAPMPKDMVKLIDALQEDSNEDHVRKGA